MVTNAAPIKAAANVNLRISISSGTANTTAKLGDLPHHAAGVERPGRATSGGTQPQRAGISSPARLAAERIRSGDGNCADRWRPEEALHRLAGGAAPPQGEEKKKNKER